MSNYKSKASNNRDFLFGGSNASSSSSAANTNPSTTKPVTKSTPSTINSNNDSPSFTSTTTTLKSKPLTTKLTGTAYTTKMAEAETYRVKATKAMQKSLFSSPDPIGASLYYQKAADAYQLCGENRLERLHRIACGDCQLGQNAYASAAACFIRAAELCEVSDENDGRKRKECGKLYNDAADAFKECGELGRMGECKLKSGLSLLIGLDPETDGDVIGNSNITGMDKEALKVIEEAIEAHVPDPLNRYRMFRQTGSSAYIDPDATANNDNDEQDDATIQLCLQHLVQNSFSHETLHKAVYTLSQWGEYKSALYAAGAASTTLEHEKLATITLSRSYCIETILTLAIGDVIAADQYFSSIHLQNTNYLSSRECKLAEDLIRAIQRRDWDALEEARSREGTNRNALANLDPSVRKTVMGLRVSGVAKGTTSLGGGDVSAMSKTVNEKQEQVFDSDALQAEMDNLMNDMGLDGDDDIDLR